MLFSDSSKQLLGLVDAIDAAFPPTNQDGTANQAARDAAIKSLADSIFASGLVLVPPGYDVTRFEALVSGIVAIVAEYKTATKRPSLPI